MSWCGAVCRLVFTEAGESYIFGIYRWWRKTLRETAGDIFVVPITALNIVELTAKLNMNHIE